MDPPLPPAYCYPPRLINDRVNDTVSGTVVTMNEWYRNELHRLQNKIRPRHCENFEELISFIVDPKLLDSFKVPPPYQLPSPMSINSYTDEEEGYEEECEQDENNSDEEEVSEEEEEEECDEDDNEDEDDAMEDVDTNYNIPNTPKSTTPDIQEEPSSPSQTHRKLSTTLCRVFLEMMRYCGRVGTTSNNAPRLLLSEFDKLREDVKNKKAINVIEFRDKLLKLLFGKIQMTEYMIKCWKFICEWVTRPPLQNHTHAMKWIEMTLGAFITARKLFLKERFIHERQKEQKLRQQQLYNKQVNSDL